MESFNRRLKEEGFSSPTTIGRHLPSISPQPCARLADRTSSSYTQIMTAIPKKLVVNEEGAPLEVIIAWSDYQDLAERLGWDLEEDDLQDLREAKQDWQNGSHDAFTPLAELK